MNGLCQNRSPKCQLTLKTTISFHIFLRMIHTLLLIKENQVDFLVTR